MSVEPAYCLFVILFLSGKKGDSKYDDERVLNAHNTYSSFSPIILGGEYVECGDLVCRGRLEVKFVITTC